MIIPMKEKEKNPLKNNSTTMAKACRCLTRLMRKKVSPVSTQEEGFYHREDSGVQAFFSPSGFKLPPNISLRGQNSFIQPGPSSQVQGQQSSLSQHRSRNLSTGGFSDPMLPGTGSSASRRRGPSSRGAQRDPFGKLAPRRTPTPREAWLPRLVFCTWDVWIRSWPCITAVVSQPSGLWCRGNYHSSRKRIRAGDSLSGSSSESEGKSTSSGFCLFVSCFFLSKPSPWLVREPLVIASEGDLNQRCLG